MEIFSNISYFHVFAEEGEFFQLELDRNRGEENFASAPLQEEAVIGCSTEYGSMSFRPNPN